MTDEAVHVSSISNLYYKNKVIENDNFPSDETLKKSQLLSSLNKEAKGELGKM